MKKIVNITSFVILLALVLTLASPTVLSQEDVVCEANVVVQSDDWLSKIAEKYYGDPLAFPAIADATTSKSYIDSSYPYVANANVIEPGWKLCLPNAVAIQSTLQVMRMMDSVESPPVLVDERTMFASLSVDGVTCETDCWKSPTACKKALGNWICEPNLVIVCETKKAAACESPPYKFAACMHSVKPQTVACAAAAAFGNWKACIALGVEKACVCSIESGLNSTDRKEDCGPIQFAIEERQKQVEERAKQYEANSEAAINNHYALGPFSSIEVVSGSQYIECPPEFTKIDVDLNQNAGGAFVYLCLKHENEGDLLNDIVVVEDNCPDGYQKVDKHLNNSDSKNSFIYFCYSKGSNPLKGVEIISSNSEDLPCLPNMRKENLDMNKGDGGNFIYLCKE